MRLIRGSLGVSVTLVCLSQKSEGTKACFLISLYLVHLLQDSRIQNELCQRHHFRTYRIWGATPVRTLWRGSVYKYIVLWNHESFSSRHIERYYFIYLRLNSLLFNISFPNQIRVSNSCTPTVSLAIQTMLVTSINGYLRSQLRHQWAAKDGVQFPCHSSLRKAYFAFEK